MTTLIITMIFSVLIINQQFSNALLDIYFNVRSVSIFNTFHEVCNNQKITVKTTIFNTFENSLDEVCNFKVEERSNFEIHDSLLNFLDEKNLPDVINGKTVLIHNSVLSQMFQDIYELKNQISNPDDKRNPSLFCFIVYKYLEYRDKFYFL